MAKLREALALLLLLASFFAGLESFSWPTCWQRPKTMVLRVQQRGAADGLMSPRDAALSHLIQTATAATAASLLFLPRSARAEDVKSEQRPEVTTKIFLNIKIANYTEESTGTNQGAKGSGRLIIGLYGNDAPESVKRFLSVIDGDGANTPTFTNTQFAKITPEGLLEVERIRGLNKMQLAGQAEYEYMGNILSEYDSPILESNSLRHDRRGLLTRNTLTATPEFGITLSDDVEKTKALDGFHCIFGEVIEGFEVLDAIAAVPTYSYATKTGYLGKSQDPLEGDITSKWFSSQKEFYVNAGKAFGDQRAVDQRGKLLRRVSILKAGRL